MRGVGVLSPRMLRNHWTRRIGLFPKETFRVVEDPRKRRAGWSKRNKLINASLGQAPFRAKSDSFFAIFIFLLCVLTFPPFLPSFQVGDVEFIKKLKPSQVPSSPRSQLNKGRGQDRIHDGKALNFTSESSTTTRHKALPFFRHWEHFSSRLPPQECHNTNHTRRFSVAFLKSSV